jgi:hypothetical protein
VHFIVIDGAEVARQLPDLVEDLARRMMEAKTSRGFLEAYGSKLGWDLISRRLRQTKQKVARGDFGEVVAGGWLQDYGGLHAPIRKLRSQVEPGQTLPGIDTIAFRVAEGMVEGIHVLESKLRTTSAYLPAVGVIAYQQLEKDRNERALDLLMYALEQLHDRGDKFAEPLSDYLTRRVDETSDAHEIALIVDVEVWDEDVLAQIDAIAGSLPNCRVHVLLCRNLAALINSVYDRAGLDLVDVMEE